MHFPKISVVTPSYNCKGLISATLDSVLGQQYPNLEYIVIDGGSTDGTAQVIEQYASQLTYWHSKQDRGQYDAINQGFAKSSGDILCWLNSDDMLLPKSLFVVAEVFKALPSVQWLSSLQPASWDAQGRLAEVKALPGFNKQAFLDGLFLPTTAKKGYWIQQESTFWRRSLWEKAGSSIPDYNLAGEFALWCKFYEHAELCGISYPLGGFRMIEGQRSEDYRSYMKEANSALKEMRSSTGWNESSTSSLAYSALADLPFAKSYISSRYGYEGSFIRNTSMKSQNPNWVIEQKRFLP